MSRQGDCYSGRAAGRPRAAEPTQASRPGWADPVTSRAGSAPADARWEGPVVRVGRGAGALGARGAKKRRPRLGRGALQNIGGADIQNQQGNCRYRTRIFKSLGIAVASKGSYARKNKSSIYKQI